MNKPYASPKALPFFSLLLMSENLTMQCSSISTRSSMSESGSIFSAFRPKKDRICNVCGKQCKTKCSFQETMQFSRVTAVQQTRFFFCKIRLFWTKKNWEKRATLKYRPELSVHRLAGTQIPRLSRLFCLQNTLFLLLKVR